MFTTISFKKPNHFVIKYFVLSSLKAIAVIQHRTPVILVVLITHLLNRITPVEYEVTDNSKLAAVVKSTDNNRGANPPSIMLIGYVYSLVISKQY